MFRFQQFTALMVVWMACLPLHASGDWYALGPFASHFGLTLAQGERTEYAGPLFYSEDAESHDLTAMPPLWSCTKRRDVAMKEVDVLYPVVSYDQSGEEYRFHVLQLLSWAGGQVSGAETNATRFTIFPFYFQQRSPVPEKNYTAVFPFYGHLKNRLFRDEVDFIGWPIYVKTQRRAKVDNPPDDDFQGLAYRYLRGRKGDVTTYNFLWPIFHVRTGAGLRGWQAWPLVGHERKEPISSTNRWGEVEMSPGHDNLFALWPVFLKRTSDLGTTNVSEHLAILPLFSKQISPLRESTTAPWPIGLTYTVDRERKYREWGAPWPLIVFARGEGKTTSRVWPFFSQSHNSNLQSDFYAWPIYKYNRFHSESVERERTRIALFLFSDITEKHLETGKTRHRVDAWPFLTFQRDLDGNQRWQALSLLEPLLPNSKSIERNYSPLWALWRSERNARTGAESQSALFNLYRQDTLVSTNAPTSASVTNKKGSMLLGLVQWQVTPEGRKAKWFYLPAETRY